MRECQKRAAGSADRDQLHDSLWRLDGGFSVAVVIVLIALIATLFTAIGTAISLAQFQIRAQLVADAAALTAADTLIGAVAGFPCENAELIASADGAFLSSCRIVGLGAVVMTTQNFGLFEVSRWAEASAQPQ